MEIVVYSDGAARGNPGPAGAGFVIYDNDGNTIKEGAYPLGVATNNVAEYTALLFAINYIKESLKEVSKISFMLDSELIVKQMNGIYKVKDDKLKPIFLDILSKLRGIDYNFTHVRREFNKVADKLSNIGCDENESTSSNSL